MRAAKGCVTGPANDMIGYRATVCNGEILHNSKSGLQLHTLCFRWSLSMHCEIQILAMRGPEVRHNSNANFINRQCI